MTEELASKVVQTTEIALEVEACTHGNRRLEHAADALGIRAVQEVPAKDLESRNRWGHKGNECSLVADLDGPFLDHAAIHAGALGGPVLLDELRVAHAARQRGTWDARCRELEHERPHLQPVPDIVSGALEVAQRQVLSKRAGLKLAA